MVGPPSAPVNGPPSAPVKKMLKTERPLRPRWLAKIVCCVLGHSVTEEDYWESDDSGMECFTRCTRCGEWDV